MRTAIWAVVLWAGWAGSPGRARSAPPGEGVRFTAVAVVIDAGPAAPAAWQVEVRIEGDSAEIVGVEGGDRDPWRDPPYYDPAALRNDRIVLADFDLGRDLPAGAVRVAVLHLMVRGEAPPRLVVRLDAAADADGGAISAVARLEPGVR